MGSKLFKRSLVIQLILGATLAIAALAFAGWPVALASAAASAVSALDLLAMALGAQRLASGTTRSRVFYSVIFGLKFPLLIAAVYLLVAVLRLDPLGLILGFSTLLVAILYASLSYQKLMAGGEQA